MRIVVLSVMVLALGMVRGADGQEPETVPAPADVPPAPVPAPPPAPPPPPQVLPPPPLLVPPLETDLVPGQPHYGPPIPLSPAHRLAMMEAGAVMPANDPRVQSAASLLERLTAGYVEDAPRIAELTVRVCGRVRAANRLASPIEMLDGALHWPRPAALRPDLPRQFERFAALYRQHRVEKGLDHAAAISALAASK